MAVDDPAAIDLIVEELDYAGDAIDEVEHALLEAARSRVNNDRGGAPGDRR
ncbi:MAG TPA: hypothetical protein VMF65_09415 [Acidimicrobiales bacterium]|nr:hypothetical protein [Acidimicrobiales bacterium]